MRWNTNFMQPPKGTRLPQAFLVENMPHRHLRTHFHDVDQFQVIMSGGGTLGKHAVGPYAIHFSRAHALRPHHRERAGHRLAGHPRVPGCRGRAVHLREAGQAGAGGRAQSLPDLRAGAIHRSGRRLLARSARRHPGRARVRRLRGSLERDGRTQRSLGYAAPDAPCLEIRAGADGLDALVLNFPRHDAPIQTTVAGKEAGFETWRCALCAFVYDEAKGMPEEGIPPGTRCEDVPDDWGCPDCAASKADFEMEQIPS
jgi:rubredoxin